MASVVEDFSGSSGALSGVWTQQRTADTVNRNGSGVGIGSINAKDLFAIYTGQSFGPDQYSQAKVAGGLSSGTQFLQLALRGSGTGDTSYNDYIFYTDGVSGATHTELAKVVNGTPTVLCNYATTFSTGDVAKIQAVGNRIYAYKNGALLTPSTGGQFVTDNTFTTGVPGIGVFGNVVTVDDWEGGDVPATILQPVVDKPLTLLRCTPLGPNNPLREVKYYDAGTVSGPATYSDEVDEVLAGSDSQTGLANFVVAASEALAAADTETGLSVFAASDTESLAAADTQTGLSIFTAAITESLSAADSQTGLANFSASRTEALSATDSETGLATFSVTRFESLSASDSQTGTTGAVTYNVTITESGSVADVQVGSALFAASRNETLAAAESAVGLWLTSASASETLAALDSQTGTVPSLASFTFRFAGGPVMTATITAGGVLVSSVTGGPVLTSSMSGGPV